MAAEPPYVVLDIGGTTLRAGLYDPASGAVTHVRRQPAQGIGALPDAPVAEIQRLVTAQLGAEIDRLLATDAGRRARGIAIAFAGPVDITGRVITAPTVWGRRAAPLPLRELLESRHGLPVLVVNDLTAATWRYATPDSAPFCLLTVSSGIGNKVFRDGRVLLDRDGHGGELGHWRCDFDPWAPLCDCGGRGHLGAIASGRGALAAARRAATDYPGAFRASSLAGATCEQAAAITNELLAAAVREGDAFAVNALKPGLHHLARAISGVFTAIGVRRYIVIGGFALAIGPPYAELLATELERVGCFGLDRRETRRMVRLGVRDDDSGLIGAGRALHAAARTAPEPADGPPGAAPAAAAGIAAGTHPDTPRVELPAAGEDRGDRVTSPT
ncbi:ROK family protein [Streptomyces polygonati]|uniref:ROK family protein n=1 Tax=Streptomyces polygonati TaxID=1617087 RepID=A0ABV8HFB4_9ACTN